MVNYPEIHYTSNTVLTALDGFVDIALTYRRENVGIHVIALLRALYFDTITIIMNT